MQTRLLLKIKNFNLSSVQNLQHLWKPLPKNLQDIHVSGVNQSFQPRQYTKMPDIQDTTKGIEWLLKKNLNPHKAYGPDKPKPIVLLTLH